MKTYKDQAEKFAEFLKTMQAVEWGPVPAAFQLSPNHKYARLFDWNLRDEKYKKVVQEKIWQEWQLLLGISYGQFAYFLQPRDRTRLVDFVGDVEGELFETI